MGIRERLVSVLGVLVVLIGVLSLIGALRAAVYTIQMKDVETVCRMVDPASLVLVENSIQNNTSEKVVVYGFRSGCDCAVIKTGFPLTIEPYQEKKVSCKLSASAFDGAETTFRTVKFHHSSDSCDLVWYLRLVN